MSETRLPPGRGRPGSAGAARPGPAAARGQGLPRWRRWLRGLLLLGVLAVLWWPPVRVDCDDPVWRDASPEGDAAVLLCARTPNFVSPNVAPAGSEGEAPPVDTAALRGWISLRDARDLVAGVVDLGRVGDAPGPVRWTADAAVLPGRAEFARPADTALPLAFLRDRLWKWRALLGFVAPDEAFR
ncbi:hypothetical protein [Roseomonas sp. BN140053]|uniref:hypothetical protein n=1 Tax=Roseomonas sp. BN140053 TaxID=3391898 RepID=UPI0039EBB046